MNQKDTTSKTEEERSSVLPEVDIYIHLNVLIYLLDENQIEKVKPTDENIKNSVTHHGEQGIELSNKTIQRMASMNRRTMDPLAARVYFYHARFYELSNRLAEIRP